MPMTRDALLAEVLKVQTRCGELEAEKAETRRAVLVMLDAKTEKRQMALAVLEAKEIDIDRDSEGRTVLRLSK